MAITLGGKPMTEQLPLVVPSLTADQVAFRVDRLRDDATTCWSCMIRAVSLAQRRDRLMTVLTDPAHHGHPERRDYIRRCVGIEMDMRHTLVSAAMVERWADTTWQALTPVQREGAATEWFVSPERETLTAAVWLDWPAFSWPPGFNWAAEVGHLGWHEVAIWLRATGKSPPDPPRLGPALELAVAEGIKV